MLQKASSFLGFCAEKSLLINRSSPRRDKNSLLRSRNFSIFIGVLNTQRFSVFVHTILEYGNQLVVVAGEKFCVSWSSE